MHPFTRPFFYPAAVLTAGLFASGAEATTIPVRFDALFESTTLSTAFQPNDTFILDSLVTTATGSLNQSVSFSVATGVTSISGFAAWEISTASSAAPRLIGVNIDVFDSSNVLVASDSMVSVLGGFATSSLAAPLGPGTYRLVATGTGVRDSSLDLSLSFAGVGSFAGKTKAVTTNALQQTSNVLTPFASGDTLFLNTLVTDETGALSQTINFDVAAGVQGFTGEAAWEITTAAGPGPRLTGLNIDIFNASNVLIASDTLVGTSGGFAISNLLGSLTPGSYKLVATGTAVRESSLNVSLTFTSVVPEPGSCATLFVAAAALLRRTQRACA